MIWPLPTMQEVTVSSINSEAVRGDVLVAVERVVGCRMDGVVRKGNMQGQYHITAVACQQLFMQPERKQACNSDTSQRLVYTKGHCTLPLVLLLTFYLALWFIVFVWLEELSM